MTPATGPKSKGQKFKRISRAKIRVYFYTNQKTKIQGAAGVFIEYL
ncbi:MAG: hypothetical protein GF383_09720 [Candidatus Lokiarchaeota archaeon]|nr:hypothetical protein [Candidatus Lokiarchaeota archaeon]